MRELIAITKTAQQAIEIAKDMNFKNTVTHKDVERLLYVEK